MFKKYLNAQNMMTAFNNGVYLEHVNSMVIYDMQNRKEKRGNRNMWIFGNFFHFQNILETAHLRLGCTLFPSTGETSDFT
jgi:hypothetical protein